MARKKIGALLEEKGLITEFQLVAALSHQRKWKTKLGQSLIELGYLEEEQLYEVLAEQLGFELIDLRKTQIPADVLKQAGKELAKEWLAIPVAYDGSIWTVAVAEPEKPGLMEQLQRCFPGQIKIVLATPFSVEGMIRKIPEKVAVAQVQPVKRAFTRNHNGDLAPVGEPEPPPATPVEEPLDDIFADLSTDQTPGEPPPPVQAEAPIEIPEPPAQEAAEPDQDDQIFSMDELPPLEDAPVISPETGAGEESSSAMDEIPGLEMEREEQAPETTDAGEDMSLELEAPHESAAGIPVEPGEAEDLPNLELEPEDEVGGPPADQGAREEAPKLISLDDLLPPMDDLSIGLPSEESPAPPSGEAPGMPGEELSAPPLDEELLEIPGEDTAAPPIEDEPLEMPGEDTAAPPIEDEPLEMPGEDIASPPLEEEPADIPDLDIPPLEEVPPLFEEERDDGPASPSLEAPSLDAPPDAGEAEPGDEMSLGVPSLDSVLSPDTFAEPPSADAGDSGAPDAPMDEAEAMEPSPAEEEPTDPFDAPPLEDIPGGGEPEKTADESEVPADEPPSLDIPSFDSEVTEEAAASGDEVAEIPPVVEKAAPEPADDVVDLQDLTEPREPAEAEQDEDENTGDLEDKIKMLEQQIRGMADVLDGLKGVLKDKKKKKSEDD